jgi:hypothetical protein
VVVLELKCTQYTTAMHKKIYRLPGTGLAKMINGHNNTSENHHQMQTAFGVLALQRLLPPNTRVGGRIVVCTDDGAMSYPCQMGFMTLSLFPEHPGLVTPNSKSKGGANRGTSAFLSKFPDATIDRKPYLDAVVPYGCTGRIVEELNGKYGSFVCKGKRANQYFLVGLLHDPKMGAPTNGRFVQSRRQLVDEAPRLRKALVRIHKLAKPPAITSCILTFGVGGKYHYHTLRGKPAPKSKSK